MTKYFKIIISLLTLIIAFAACDNDKDILQEISTLDPNSISVVNLNPSTGKEYTLEELGSLKYDVSKENYFDSTQTVQIYIYVPGEAQRIEARKASGTAFKTVTEFEKVEGLNKAYFEFTVLELGLEILNSTHLTFLVTYMENGKELTGSVVYKIHHIVKYIPPQFDSPVWLIKSAGDSIEIPVNVANELMSYGGKFGTILNHEGSNYAGIESGSYLDFRYENDFSVGIWVNTTVNQDDPIIIGDKDWGSGSNPGFLFAQIGNNWKLNVGDGSKRVDISGTNINDGHWHFLTVTFDRDGEATLYTDGIKNGAKDMSVLGSLKSGLAFNLGQDGTGKYQMWEGKTAGTYIYNYVLTPEEILAIGASGVTLLKSDGSKSPLHVTNESTSKTLDGNKVVYDMDGSDDLVTVDTIPELEFRFESDFSLAVWVNTTVNQDDPVIMGDKDWGSGSNPGWLLVQIGNNWKLNMAGVGSGTRIDIKGNDINDGNWHLIGATFDRDGLVTIYQDGVAVDSKDMSHVANMKTPQNYPIRLAQDGTGMYSPKFKGKVANAVVADFALTAEQMMELFNQ
jgi:hypothetical protein